MTKSLCCAFGLYALIAGASPPAFDAPDPTCFDQCTRRYSPGHCLNACSDGRANSDFGWFGSVDGALPRQRTMPPSAVESDKGEEIGREIEEDRRARTLRQVRDLEDIKSRLFK